MPRGQASDRVDEDMFFLVDVAFTWRKLRRWTQLFSRVKPFFGTLNLTKIAGCIHCALVVYTVSILWMFSFSRFVGMRVFFFVCSREVQPEPVPCGGAGGIPWLWL
jgi:hypothetical protein